MSSVADRRNQQIWDAIDNDNLKQALQLCAKRVKKGEKGDYLLALRAHILTLSSSQTQNQEGFAAAVALVGKDPPVTDLDTLRLLQLALSNLESRGNLYDVKGHLSTLWERAIKAKPGDEELAREWFLKSFQDRNWRNAQKAAMSLQKSYSKKREYFFWAILSCHLLYSSPDTAESERKLFGTLAYRMISKAAADVPESPETLLSPGRAIQTPQELHLLLLIYTRQGYRKEALTILNSKNLGIQSTVAKGDWSFVQKKLELLEEEGLWKEEWDFCKSLLDEASPENSGDNVISASTDHDAKGDDWRIWQGFLTACRKINDKDNLKLTENRIESFIKLVPKSRNAKLAQLEFVANNQDSEGNLTSDATVLFSLCRGYFDTFGKKNCCFDDLKIYVEMLDPQQQVELIKYIQAFADQLSSDVATQNAKLAYLASLINGTKFEYLIKFSLKSTEASHSAMETFVSDALALYKHSLNLGADLEPTDNQHGDDACILAVMALVRLSETSNESVGSSLPQRYLFQAAALLEFLLTRSRHNFQALLILVRLYGLLGAHSLVFETYSRLPIKQIQHDTLSHNMFTRISTLHPNQLLGESNSNFEKGDQDPSLGLMKASAIYDKSARQVSEMNKLALERGSYGQVEGFLEFAARVQDSICKIMWNLEKRRIDRLLRTKSHATDIVDTLPLDLISDSFSDNRDDNVVISCEGSKLPHFETSIRIGPKPKDRWVAMFCHSEALSTYFAMLNDPTTDERVLHDPKRIPASSAVLPEFRDASEDEFTDPEMSFLTLQFLLVTKLKAILETQSGGAKDVVVECLEEVVQQLELRLSSAVDTESISEKVQGLAIHDGGKSANSEMGPVMGPSWEFFHEAYLTMETLNSVSAYAKYIDARGKNAKSGFPKNATTEVTKRISDLHSAIRSRAANIINQLSESGVVSALVDMSFERQLGGENDTIGAVIEQLVGEPWMETHIARVVESWNEGLNGVLRLKVH